MPKAREPLVQVRSTKRKNMTLCHTTTCTGYTSASNVIHRPRQFCAVGSARALFRSKSAFLHFFQSMRGEWKTDKEFVAAASGITLTCSNTRATKTMKSFPGRGPPGAPPPGLDDSSVDMRALKKAGGTFLEGARVFGELYACFLLLPSHNQQHKKIPIKK